MGPEEPGSLAGSGISWGERQLNDGYLSGVPRTPSWLPPPGNGFGFLARPRRARPAGPWTADWPIDVGTNLRLHVPASEGVEVVTSVAPGIRPDTPKARYVYLRRSGAAPLSSAFVTAIEPYGKAASISRIETTAAGEVERAGGVTDYLIASPDGKRHSTPEFSLTGRFAFVRVKDGSVVSVSMAGASELTGMGLNVRLGRDAWSGTASRVDVGGSMVETELPLPGDASLKGAVIYFRNPCYSRSTAYRIERVQVMGKKRVIHLSEVVALGRGQVGKILDGHTITTTIPHEYARTPTRNDSRFFQGKRICSASGACATINGMQPAKGILEVSDTSRFRPGEFFEYQDLQAGDQFEIPVLYHRAGPVEARASGNCSTSATPPSVN